MRILKAGVVLVASLPVAIAVLASQPGDERDAHQVVLGGSGGGRGGAGVDSVNGDGLNDPLEGFRYRGVDEAFDKDGEDEDEDEDDDGDVLEGFWQASQKEDEDEDEEGTYFSFDDGDDGDDEEDEDELEMESMELKELVSEFLGESEGLASRGGRCKKGLGQRCRHRGHDSEWFPPRRKSSWYGPDMPRSPSGFKRPEEPIPPPPVPPTPPTPPAPPRPPTRPPWKRPGGRFPPHLPPRRPPHHKPPHHGPPHHGKSNLTLFEMIATSKYTTRLYALIKNDTELVDLLNSTKSSLTLFAPTDKAFERIPGHGGGGGGKDGSHGAHEGGNHTHPHPSPEFIKKVLLYHVLPDGIYDMKKLYFSKTVPTALKAAKDDENGLGEDVPQRLRVTASVLGGVRVNFFSKVVAGDIFGTNGVIHGIDHILIPPPTSSHLLQLLPTKFSTTLYASLKTKIEVPHGPKTIFPPPNWAWNRLGLRINAFLFSHYGERILKALLKYHVSPGNVLYSDHLEKEKHRGDDSDDDGDKEGDKESKPKGYFHVDLKTLLNDRTISIDINRWGKFVKWKVNGGTRIVITDVITRDGVMQIPNHVLIPPHHDKEPPASSDFRTAQDEALENFEAWKAEYDSHGESTGMGMDMGGWFLQGGNDVVKMEVEELVERLLPYVD